jgi:hypothetical protein
MEYGEPERVDQPVDDRWQELFEIADCAFISQRKLYNVLGHVSYESNVEKSMTGVST